jgi:DNA-binding CsgD family transcriptional regulator
MPTHCERADLRDLGLSAAAVRRSLMGSIDRYAGNVAGSRLARLLIDQQAVEVTVTAPGWQRPNDPSQFPLLVEIDDATKMVEGRRVRYLTQADAGSLGDSKVGSHARLQVMGLADSEIVARLTTREREVLTQLAKGASNGAIARTLGISIGTVRVHVKSVLRKLALENRTQAAVWATVVARDHL